MSGSGYLSPVGASAAPLDWPPWIIWHVPHDATQIPEPWDADFLLDSEALADELVRMTDHHTAALFSAEDHPNSLCRAEVSRLLVDVERFPDDADEPMADRGMGAIYTHGSQRQRIRHPVGAVTRRALLDVFYWPHHKRLERLVEDRLSQHGRVLILDCHSFPSVRLPYELDGGDERPEICIGADAAHTPTELIATLKALFEAHGFSTAVNRPFAGALVPLRYYRQDLSVASVMIEVRRDLYIHEQTGARLPSFDAMRTRIADVLSRGIRAGVERFSP